MWDNRVWLVEHGEGGKEGERDVLGATSRASWKRRQGATWRASWKRWQVPPGGLPGRDGRLPSTLYYSHHRQQ